MLFRNHAVVLAILEGHCRCGGVAYRLKPPYEFAPLESCAKVHLALAGGDGFRLVVGEELLAGDGSWQLCRRCGTMLFFRHQDGRRYCLASTLDRSELLPGALHAAAGSGKWRPRTLGFIQRGFAVDAEIDGDTPLAWAARSGDLQSFRALLEHGAEPSKAIDASAIQGQEAPELQRMLLKAGCEPQELLSATAATSALDAVQVVLKAGADVNRRDLEGRLPLYRACGNSTEIVQALLEHGADPSLVNGDGAHSLHYCVSRNLSQRLQILLEAGAPVNLVEKNSAESALYVACDEGRLECAKLLLNYGAEPNLGRKGTTPLMAASRHGSLALVELLLDRGADVERLNGRGYSARDMASAFLPDLLTRATEMLLSRRKGRVQHRWGTAEAGERQLKLRQRGDIYRWCDYHAEILERFR